MRLIIFLGCILFSALLSAHEYWLDPVESKVSPAGQIEAHIRVGQNFKGDSYAFLPNEVEQVQIHWQGQSQIVKPRFGASPALKQAPLGTGLNILSLVTNAYSLTYTDPAIFEKFLKIDGLEWVKEAHKKRGLPEVGFVEAYYRYAKTLVDVGNVAGEDQKTGMKFEWVMQARSAKTNGSITARLYWEHEIYANAPCKVFIRKGDTVEILDLKTDESGDVRIPYAGNAKYLLNSVLMKEPYQKNVENLKAVWESHWASVTFSTQ